MDPEHAEQLAGHHMREDRQYKAEQRKKLEALIRRIVREEIAKHRHGMRSARNPSGMYWEEE